MEKKCKKAKWMSEEALQKAEKRGEAQGKVEKERQPTAVFWPKEVYGVTKSWTQVRNFHFLSCFLAFECMHVLSILLGYADFYSSCL